MTGIINQALPVIEKSLIPSRWTYQPTSLQGHLLQNSKMIDTIDFELLVILLLLLVIVVVVVVVVVKLY